MKISARPLLHCLLAASLTAAQVAPATADEATVRDAMQQKFPYAHILAVHRLPYDHLYEVAFDDHVVYTDDALDFMLSGDLYDLRTMRNLTAASTARLYGSHLDTLPLKLAIKTVHGNGSRRLAVFTDPQCPYCKRLEAELAHLDNATIYTFVLTILPGSMTQAQRIWCAPNRQRAWENHMLRGIEPTTTAKCDTSALTQIAHTAQSLNIRLTPTLYFADGSLHPGYMSLDQLNEALGSTPHLR